MSLEELNALELHMMKTLGYCLRVGALPITQTLARINASADAPAAEFAARFGRLLDAGALATLQTEAAVATTAEARTALSAAAASGAGDGQARPQIQQQRQQAQQQQHAHRSSLDCGAAASVVPFVACGIAAH